LFVTSVRCRRLLLAVSGVLLPACLDLGLPNVPPDGGVGPSLTIIQPRPGDTIPLSASVEVNAVAVNGMDSVTVTCGGAPSTGVFTWSVEPYSGVVDFTRCTLVATGVADSGVGQLQLTFIAVDRLGKSSVQSVNVFLDTSTASLFAALPARVPPLSRLTLTVGSDRPLLLPPTVRLAGREADGITQRTNPDGGAPLYDVTFLQAPGLGIDNYTGDRFNVPFEVLSEVEKTVSVTIDARAANGNSSHLEQAVLLSRVLWDRVVPGRITVDAAEPVATSRGIQVALAKNNATPNANSDWLPGFFRASDGTYVPFDPSQIMVSNQPLPVPDAGEGPDAGADAGPDAGADAGADGGNGGEGGTPDGGPSDGGPLDAGLNDAGVVTIDAGLATGVVPTDGGSVPFPVDGGFVAADFDARGNVLFTRPSTTPGLGSDVIALGEPINGPRPATGYSVQFFLDSLQSDGGVAGPALTRMDDLLCPPDELNGLQDGCFYGAATHQVECLQAGTGQVLNVLGTSSTLPLAPPLPGGTAGAYGPVRTYLSPNDASPLCGPAWTFFAFPPNVFAPQDRSDPWFAGCSVQSVDRLLPLFDGGFVLGLTVDCGTVSSVIRYLVLRVDPTGAISGSYLAQPGVTLGSQPLVLAALADGTVVTMRNDPPYTTYDAWKSDGAGPVATARIPGHYVYTASGSRLGTNVRAASDGSFSVLLNNSALGDVVVQFARGMQPLWIYRYPRVVLPGTPSVLIADPTVGTVYYVDPTNNEIVALKRF
jgi:hypothetical protein